MPTIKAVIALIAILTLPVGGGAQAAGEDVPLATRFKALDRDADGRLSSDEWKGPPPRFKQLDQDQDGFISAAEFSDGVKPNADQEGREKPGKTPKSCEACQEQWHQCMIGKAGFVKQNCDAAMYRCKENCT